MKKSIFILVITGFLLIGLSEIQAQTTQPKLNQVELMKQLIGSWKCDWGNKDTTGLWEAKPFGTGLESNWKEISKGKIVMERKQLWGYDKKIDKIVEASLEKGQDIGIYVLWFISNNKLIEILYSDITSPDNASLKCEIEIKSPNMLTQTIIMNGKLLNTYTFTRIK